MGFFTIGDLVTLGIVAVSLVLYRYLDKNNRSLDRVRKYAEQCMSKIAAYTEEKSAAVRDFGISLDVERKAASELMRHIHALTEEELANKAQAIAQIDERIRAYDASMEELVGMTARVQENLNRIRDESAFVESTGRRVGEAREKLEHFEKALGGTEKKLDELEQRLRRENADALEKAAGEVTQAALSRLSGFEASAETIEQKIEDHREAVLAIEREREAALARDFEAINKTLKEAVERAGSRADKMEDAALVKLRDQAQERLSQFKSAWEEKIKTAQETVKSRLGDIQEQLKSGREEWKTESSAIEARQKAYREAWKKDVQELNALAKQRKDELGASLAQQREELNGAAARQQDELNAAMIRQRTEWDQQFRELNALVSQQSEALNAAIARQRETAGACITEQRDNWDREIQELSARAEQQSGELSAALVKQQEEWTRLARDAEHSIIAASEARLAEYKQAQAEDIRQLGNLADDAARMETELRRSMQDAVGRVNGDFARFGEETRRAQEAAAAEFNSRLAALLAELDGVNRELSGLKAQALENVSGKLKLFEDDFAADLGRRSAGIENRFAEWREGLEAQLAEIAGESAGERRRTETRLNDELKKNLTEQGERLVSELERLKTETVAFEEGIREEMKAADETRRSFNEQLARDLEAARISAENEARTQIGQYSLSMSETMRQTQRDLEERLREIAAHCEAQTAGIETAIEHSRRGIEDWQGQYNAQMRDLDISMEEIRRRNRELSAENDERIAQARLALDEIRKEISAQAKLFDRTDALKLELERGVEDLNGDMDRLEQRKKEIADIERQFTQIKRLEDDVNAKMTRFLSEKRRIEVMETDFNRLLQTSQAVEEKLAQVSSSDDTLQAMQVQIRRLEDAIQETEEKYQRIERKSQTMEETNAGIDRNFRALQESEAALAKADEAISLLGGETETLRVSIETLANENGKARDAADKLSTLDESLSLIEKRIAEMNVAREWLARTETELRALDKDAQTQLRLTRSLLDRDAKTPGGKAGPKGAPPPRDRDNIIKLRRQGWTVEEIAKTMDISKGEVELVLELSPRD
jgi:chromosome segregation ATPase